MSFIKETRKYCTVELRHIRFILGQIKLLHKYFDTSHVSKHIAIRLKGQIWKDRSCEKYLVLQFYCYKYSIC